MGHKEEVSEYDQQAIDFLKETGAKITKVYTGHRPYWDDEKEFRATYIITITRGDRSAMTFPFGQSMMDSWSFSSSREGYHISKPFNGSTFGGVDLFKAFKHVIETGDDKRGGRGAHANVHSGKEFRTFTINKKEKAPSDYTILAALTKYDPGTFQNFCDDYGYDTDSRKAEKTYHAVIKEYDDLSRLFTSEELEKMAEIQ